MDKAKHAVSDFMAKKGNKDTVVDQDQRAAITEEHVRPERHEETTTAVNKEIHQDHHQTIVQPINHTEKLAEKHTHNAVPVQHKHFEHDKAENTRALIDDDAAKYRNSSVKHDTINTTTKAPVVAGEETYHHLHQHIQPVIHKDTIAPEVVHTTVPIHETHHAQTVSHGTTTLPSKTLAEFEQEQGGLLKGQSLHNDNVSGRDGTSGDYKMASTAANRAYTKDSSAAPRTVGQTSGVGAGTTSDGIGHNTSGATGASRAPNGSLIDKLNPFKDADHDGKKGMMS